MRRTVLISAVSLLAAACGGGGGSPVVTEAGGSGEQTPIVMPDSTADPAGSTSPAPDLPSDLPESDYPDVVVVDLAGENVNLRSLVLEPKPVLLWFWAPH